MAQNQCNKEASDVDVGGTSRIFRDVDMVYHGIPDLIRPESEVMDETICEMIPCFLKLLQSPLTALNPGLGTQHGRRLES